MTQIYLSCPLIKHMKKQKNNNNCAKSTHSAVNIKVQKLKRDAFIFLNLFNFILKYFKVILKVYMKIALITQKVKVLK